MTKKDGDRLLQLNLKHKERWFYNLCILHCFRSFWCYRGKASHLTYRVPVSFYFWFLINHGHLIAEVCDLEKPSNVSSHWSLCFVVFFLTFSHLPKWRTRIQSYLSRPRRKPPRGLGQCPVCGYKAFTSDIRPREMETRGKEVWTDSGEGRTAGRNVAARRGELCQDWKRETSVSARNAHAGGQALAKVREAHPLRRTF